MRVLIIVPAFNESDNIRNVVSSIRGERVNLPLDELDTVVVNDGSKDDTSRCAKDEGAIVLELPFNLGIGGAVQTGFMLARNQGYDAAVQIDGDGQHDPAFLNTILEPLRNGEADVVIGSRFLERSVNGFQSTRMRRAGIQIFRWVNSLILRQRLTDNTSGFRAYNRDAILFLAHQYPTDYPEPESVVMMGKAGYRLVEIPVEMRVRQGGASSITFWRSGYYMIKVLLAIVMSALRKRVARKEEGRYGRTR